jgi:GNAT superfamily N-acetyltransferase
MYEQILKPIPLNLKVIQSRVVYKNDVQLGGEYIVIHSDNQRVITSFVIEPMAGCSGIALFRAVDIREDYRGKGYGIHFLNLREKIALDFGYGVAMCTIVDTNKPQAKIMQKSGWQKLYNFTNPRTTNNVSVYVKKLSFEGILPINPHGNKKGIFYALKRLKKRLFNPYYVG